MYGKNLTRVESETKYNSENLNKIAYNGLIKCLINNQEGQEMLSFLYENSENFKIFFNEMNLFVSPDNSKQIKAIELQINDFNRYVRYINVLLNQVKIADLNEAFSYEIPSFSSDTGFILLEEFELFDDGSFLNNYKKSKLDNKYFVVFEYEYFKGLTFDGSNTGQVSNSNKKIVVCSFKLNEITKRLVKEYKPIIIKRNNDRDGSLDTFPLNPANVKRYSLLYGQTSFTENGSYITNKIIKVDDKEHTNDLYYVSILISFGVYDEKNIDKDLYDGSEKEKVKQKSKTIVKYTPIKFIDQEYNGNKIVDLFIRKNILKSTVLILDPVIVNLKLDDIVFNNNITVFVDENDISFEISVSDYNTLMFKLESFENPNNLLELIDTTKNGKVLLTTKAMDMESENGMTKLTRSQQSLIITSQLANTKSNYNVKLIDELLKKINSINRKENLTVNAYCSTVRPVKCELSLPFDA